MHDAKDEIIYVGKAISLKNRVRQYFQKSRHVSPKIERMIDHIAWFEYIVTDSGTRSFGAGKVTSSKSTVHGTIPCSKMVSPIHI